MLAGEVSIGPCSAIWYNTVIRGDLNAVNIDQYASIGDHTVVHTVASVGTGTTAAVNIGANTIIGSHCSLSSCYIGKDCYIGPNCTILPGARLEDSCVLAPGSVVPPGRLIPSNQVWGGNPVEFLRPLNYAEEFANYSFSYKQNEVGEANKEMYSFMPNAYMMKPISREDYEVPHRFYENYGGQDIDDVLNDKYP